MRCFTIIIVALFASLLTVGQPRNIALSPARADSLKMILLTSQNKKEKTEILRQLSWLYVFSLPDSALKFSLQGLRLTEELNAKQEQIDLLTVEGRALAIKGNFSQALKTDLTALELSEKLGNDSLITWCYLSVGTVYFYAEDYFNALQYFKKTKTYPLEYNKQRQLFPAFIGESYFHLNQFDSANFYIQQSYSLMTNGGWHWSLPYLYMGKLYEKKGLPTEALRFYRSSITEKVPITDSIKSFLAIANLFKQMQSFDSGIYYARLAYSTAQKTSSYLYVGYASSLLRDFYKFQKKADSASKYLEIMLVAKDNLFNQEKNNQIENITFNEQQRQQEEAQYQKELQNKIKLYSLLAVLVIFFLVGLLLYRSNLQIEMQKVRDTISRDLHDEIGSTLSSISMLSATAEHSLQNKEAKSAEMLVQRISSSSQRILDVMDEIIWAINPAKDSFENIIEKIRGFMNDIADTTEIKFNMQVDDSLEKISLPMKLKRNFYLIFKEALNNAANHSQCQIINISIDKKHQFILLQIKDDGKGFNASKNFEGNGLKNMRQRAGEIHGVINIHSEINKGTILTLTVPIP